jgi:hypothetical protein
MHMAEIKKLQTYARDLRAVNVPEPEIRRLVDQYEAKLDREAADEAAANARAPEGLSPQRYAGDEIERASTGRPALQGEARVDHRHFLTADQIARINFERACDGKDPITANEIAAENIRRSMVDGADEPEAEPAPEYAPRGMHPTALVRANFDRSCKGLPDLLPHPSDAKGRK